MSAAAVIDSLEFARAGDELRGSVPVISLKRLDDVLFDREGRLDYELRGSRDEHNRPQLELRISGPLHLQCQRCLGLLNYGIDIAATLRVVPRDTQPQKARTTRCCESSCRFRRPSAYSRVTA